MIAPDMPGYGKSKAKKTFKIDELAKWCADFMWGMNVKYFHVIGNFIIK